MLKLRIDYLLGCLIFVCPTTFTTVFVQNEWRQNHQYQEL